MNRKGRSHEEQVPPTADAAVRAIQDPAQRDAAARGGAPANDSGGREPAAAVRGPAAAREGRAEEGWENEGGRQLER